MRYARDEVAYVFRVCQGRDCAPIGHVSSVVGLEFTFRLGESCVVGAGTGIATTSDYGVIKGPDRQLRVFGLSFDFR